MKSRAMQNSWTKLFVYLYLESEVMFLLYIFLNRLKLNYFMCCKQNINESIYKVGQKDEDTFSTDDISQKTICK